MNGHKCMAPEMYKNVFETLGLMHVAITQSNYSIRLIASDKFQISSDILF